ASRQRPVPRGHHPRGPAAPAGAGHRQRGDGPARRHPRRRPPMTRRDSAARLLLLAAVLVLALGVSIRVGAVPLGVRDILAALVGEGDPAVAAIIRDLRLPRAIVAALVGAALAASGATFQALLRNPLAEPYVLGVSGGASLGAVGVIVLARGAGPTWALPLAAFGGALAAIVLVLRIASSVGRSLDTAVLLLAGVVAGAFFNACILVALTFTEAESFRSAI